MTYLKHIFFTKSSCDPFDDRWYRYFNINKYSISNKEKKNFLFIMTDKVQNFAPPAGGGDTGKANDHHDMKDVSEIRELTFTG